MHSWGGKHGLACQALGDAELRRRHNAQEGIAWTAFCVGPIHRYADRPAHNSDNTKHLHFFIRRAILEPTEKIHNKHSKPNGPERLVWPESHTENRVGGFAKE